MHLGYIFTAGLSVAAAFLSVLAVDENTEPEIQVVASFPESNPFGHVVNGEKNGIFLNIINKSDRNVTLVNVGGSFHHPETEALVKNTSIAKYNLLLPAGEKIQFPYAIYSEFKPGDLRLNLWLEYKTDGETYRVPAYDSIITVVEPESSLFDFKMISTYFVVALIFGALVYVVFASFAPPPKKNRPRKAAASAVRATDVTANATGANAYEEEWIPEHHIKKTKAGKKGGLVVSGDDQSGAETSGTEAKVRRGRK